MTISTMSKSELKNKRASDYKDGDIVSVGKYLINIRFTSRDGQRTYDSPALCSYVERRDTGKILNSTPGVELPYYIDDFINR